MSEPTDSKAEILNGFEAFCARLGFILCYYATTLVLVVIILSVLVFSVRLTSFLESIEWGVTFFAIVLGLVINWVYDDHLTDILYQLMRKGEILAKTPMRDPINQVTTHGAVLTYLFFVFSGFLRTEGCTVGLTGFESSADIRIGSLFRNHQQRRWCCSC